MGALTTHVLDTSLGRPGRGIRVELFSLGSNRAKLRETETNDDGRSEAPLLQGQDFKEGTYELVFHVSDYFKKTGGIEVSSPPFLGEIVIRFNVGAAHEHYHVPLLLSRYGYTTYRGS